MLCQKLAMTNTVTLQPYFGAAVLASAATVLRANELPRSRFLFERVITPEAFEPAVFSFMVFLGLVLIASTPRPTLIRAVVERIETFAFTGFSAIAGAIGGWGLAACVLHLFATGSAGIFAALMYGGYAIVLTLGPLFGFEKVVQIFRESTRLRFRERRGAATIHIIGWLLTLYGLWNIWQWVVHG